MNPRYEDQLEARIERELGALPHLKAPVELQSRVMAAIEAKSMKRPVAWMGWPVALRAATMTVLLAGFAGLCFAGWHFSHSGVLNQLSSTAAGIWAPIALVLSFFETLGTAIVVVLKNLNGFVLAGLLLAAAIAYFTWLSLGALWFRIAFARR